MTTSSEAGSAGTQASIWEDFVDIFYAPRSVFERRRDAEFLVPLIIIATIIALIALVSIPVLGPLYELDATRPLAQAVAKGKMTQDQADAARSLMTGARGWLTAIGAIVGAFVAPLLVGIVTWIIGKFAGIAMDIKAACMVATYASTPRIIDGISRLLQGYLFDPSKLDSVSRLTLSAARFADPETTSVGAIAALLRIDLFTFWATALLAIGISVVGRVSLGRAALVAALVWLAASLPALVRLVSA